MHVGIPSVSLPDPEERSSAPDIITDYRMHDQNRLSFLRNKPPRWNSGTQSHCLNFGGRVTVASIKNFQLVMENADLASRPVMQFGRTGPDSFCMDVTYPLSVAEAFSLALSTFSAYDAS
ncbi:tubby C-terminal-like domain-containing protein [Hyaloraphidium curvatum]|nr:tubby C-terminal-like domain-containing protein [Hyaloraphidium curvatum]